MNFCRSMSLYFALFGVASVTVAFSSLPELQPVRGVAGYVAIGCFILSGIFLLGSYVL